MKRTVIVLNHFAQPLTSPGGTRHVELFSKLSGWDARVIAADRNMIDGSDVEPGGVLETVRVTPYSGNGLSRIVSWCSYAVTATARAVSARRVDVVYGSSPHLLAGLAAWFVARVRRVPFVLEVRDLWPRVLVDMGALDESSLTYRALHWLERLLYRRADRVVILASGAREHVTRHGVPDEAVVFIPNGADVEDFVPTGPRQELRKRYGFDGVVAVYAGAHGPANGLDLLLDAASEVEGSCPELKIVLIGDGATKQALVARVALDGLTNVTFMAPIPKSEIKDVLAAADIGVHCLADVDLFRSAVSPNKLFDYMAAGLPVITNTPGDIGQLVADSGGGLAVGPRGLDGALRQLYESSAQDRRRLGATAQSFLAANRSRTVMVTRMQTTLDDLCARM